MGPLIDWDQRSQRAIEALSGSWADLPMHVVSTLEYFLPVLLAAWIWLVWRGGTRGRAAATVALLLVLLTDQLSASVLKPLFARPRPHSLSPGFPSSHASNLFGQAMLFSRIYPRLTAVLFLIAGLGGFSRVYLGKHYPLDVVFGAVLGCACGWFAAYVAIRYDSVIETAWRRIFGARRKHE